MGDRIELAKLVQEIGKILRLSQKESLEMSQIDYAVAGIISVTEDEKTSNHLISCLFIFLTHVLKILKKQKT